tara:strand:- start:1660 stop:1968 length:309 start_codon:yes stop_codon:yes gene_type:complete
LTWSRSSSGRSGHNGNLSTRKSETERTRIISRKRLSSVCFRKRWSRRRISIDGKRSELDGRRRRRDWRTVLLDLGVVSQPQETLTLTRYVGGGGSLDHRISP